MRVCFDGHTSCWAVYSEYEFEYWLEYPSEEPTEVRQQDEHEGNADEGVEDTENSSVEGYWRDVPVT